MTRAPLLSATGLGIMRGERVLFSQLSLSLNAGEALLVRGDNGTGKTTLLRVLAGLTETEAGTRKTSLCHWVGHRSGLKPHETPRTHLQTWARSWGADASQIDPILGKLALARAGDVPASSLSAGQRKRTSLARTQLVNRPVWLLDEPFSALDADGKAHIAALIAAHRSGGGAVIAAVHGEVPVEDTRELTL
ncbi:MAG: heme ABC exporter ATP-binding protein CcmA [Hyphomonadaceae bacterium]